MAVYVSLLEESNSNFDTTVLENHNPLQFGIDLERINLAMFESLVQLDMVEVCNEKGLISITEEEQEAAKKVAKEGIISKIKAAISKFVENAKLTLQKFLQKFNEVFKIDFKLIKNLYFLDKDLENCTLSDVEYVDYTEFEKYRDSIEYICDDLLRDIDRYSYLHDSVASAEEDLKKAKDIKIDTLEDSKDRFIKKITGPINKADKNQIEKLRKCRVMIKYLNSEVNKQYTADLNKLKAIAKKVNTATKSQMVSSNNDAAAKIGKMEFERIAINLSKCTMGYNTLIKANLLVYKTTRSCFIKVGKWILKKKKENDSESVSKAYYYALGEMSDIYVDEALSLV